MPNCIHLSLSEIIMTDQPIANSELAEQLSSLSDAIDNKISTISDFLSRAEQLCQSAQASEAAVAQMRQEIMEAVTGASIGDSTIADRLGALESQLTQLQESLPRLAQDVKNYARLAQHMDQCAEEVHQWYHELQQSKGGTTSTEEIQARFLEIHNALEAYSQSQQALAEQLALAQSPSVDLSSLEAKIQALETSSGVDLSGIEQRLAQLEGASSGAAIDEAQLQAVVERLVSDREQSLRNEMTTIQRDWQDGAAILQQMQVRIESLESRGGDATTAQLEALRSEMASLIAKAKTEQETALREQRRQLEEMGSQGGKTTIALVLALVGVVLGGIGLARR